MERDKTHQRVKLQKGRKEENVEEKEGMRRRKGERGARVPERQE